MNDEIAIIYDGECPMCSQVVLMLELQRAFAQVQLIDARLEQHQGWRNEVIRRGYDLNEGMVVRVAGADETYYYGDRAMLFLVRYWPPIAGSRVLLSLMSQPWLAKLTYPVLKAVRRYLLRDKALAPFERPE